MRKLMLLAFVVSLLVAAPALAQPPEPEPLPVITTYTWNGGEFVAHTSFDGSFLGDEVRIAFDAWNGQPGFPALWVDWDDVFSGVDLVLDDFDDGVLSSIWGITRSSGADVIESGGVVTSVIPAGTRPGGFNQVAGLYTSDFILSGDFDVAIDFTLSPDFHTSPGSAAKFLTQDAAGFFAELGIRPGSFQSNEVGPGVWINHESTDTDQLEGRLRITRSSSVWFDGHEYALFGHLPWHDAVDHCANIGAHLVTIGSAEENDFVFGLTPNTWLGATDEAVEGVWEWVTGEPFDYTNWAPGEPNNSGGDESQPEHYLTWAFPPDGRWNDVPDGELMFVCEWGVQEVDIDIKPGSDPNSINLRSKGVIPVAVLGSSTFDVTDIDVNTLIFVEAYPAHDLTDPATYADHLQDVNLDGYTDLVSHYRTQETGIGDLVNEVPCLSGETIFGPAFVGCDEVNIVK
jgi:hypothetical protein